MNVVDSGGLIQNSYQYDPFGKMIQHTEQIRNIYKYVGSQGVISDEELQNIFMMRDRHYDAEHGRFISMDPIGSYTVFSLLCKSPAKDIHI